MRKMRLVVLLSLLLAGLVAPSVSLAAPPERPGSRPVVVRRVYAHPYWWHRPYWYDPFYSYDPYWYRRYPAVNYEDDLGAVQVKVKPDDGAKARLYINGAMANEFKSKDKVKLKPGEYSIEIRKPGYESEARAVYVTAGKTLKLEFNLERSG